LWKRVFVRDQMPEPAHDRPLLGDEFKAGNVADGSGVDRQF
jgi:hypothetical protein